MKPDWLFKLGIFVGIGVCGGATGAAADLPLRKHQMALSAPASQWEHAMPTGNGQVGALVFGEIQRETVILTHDALWLRTEKPVLPDVSKHLPEVRRLLAAGQYDEAAKFFTGKITENYAYNRPDPFHPAFNITVGTDLAGSPQNPRRTVDFETGEVTVTWTQEGVDYERRLFVSRTDDVVVMRVRASKPGVLNCRLGLLPLGLERNELGDGRNARVPRFPENKYKPKIGYTEVPITFNLSADSQILALRAEYDTGGPRRMTGGEYGGLARVMVKGGTCTAADLQVAAQAADEVLLVCKLYANERSRAATPRIASDLQKLPADYEALLQRHTAVHRDLFRRSRLDLGAEERFRVMNNEELIAAVKQGRGLTAMFERLHDFGRYALICSSRPGSMPPNLQGIWNGEYGPIWASDYHNDINIQMAYFQALPGNMAEITLPYFHHYNSLVEDFRANARNIYGCRGILAPIAHSTHGLIYNPFASWTAGAGWLAELYYDYWLFTGDRDFLQRRAVPFMKEVALFYEDFLFEGEDGKYVFSPSFSPENYSGNSPSRSSWLINATMDITVARELLHNLCTACELLGIEREGVKRWRAMLAKLPEYMINQDGALKEWTHPAIADQYNHRHMSHLHGLFPGYEFNPESRPDLMPAIRVALDKRMATPGTEPSWTFPLLACNYARLEDGAGALQALQRLIREYLWPNLFMLHEKRRPVLQFDATSGLTAAVQEMLVFSTPDMIRLLPALPGDWPAGGIEGVQTRAGVEVSLQWDKKLRQIDARFLSRTARQVTVKLPAPVVSVKMEGEGASVDASALGNSYRKLSLPAGRPVSVCFTVRSG
jgi:alpha-L-fucosidase 2